MPDVLFLPGFMQHADSWSPVAAAVGERYPSTVLDFATWTFEERLGEIRAAAGPQTVVVGYSMGGRLALRAALEASRAEEAGARPAFAGLALLGASAGIEDRDERRLRREADEELARWIESHPIERVVARWETNPVFATQPEPLVDAQRAGRLRHDPALLARLLRSAGQGALEPLWGRIAELRMPLLALAGALDAKYAAASARLAAQAPRGETATIPDAGHAAHLEQPETVADALLAWIGDSVVPGAV